MKRLLCFLAIWVVEASWPGYPFVRYRWYHDCGCKSPWIIEWYKSSIPPHPSTLKPLGAPDKYYPGGPLNL